LSFVQKESAVHSNRRAQASKMLADAARELHNPRLAALSNQVKLDAFTRVKKVIDDMVAALLKEKDDEIKHKEFCVEELNTNQKQTEKKQDEKADVLALIDDLEQSIEDLKDALKTLRQEIADMQLALKEGGEDRERANHEFQATIADQRATQKLLKATLAVLEGFYKKKAAAALLQQPAGFEEYKKNENSGGVMAMIQEIINDATTLEAEATRAEEDAQKSYEDFVKETNKSIEANSKSIANKAEELAKAESDLVNAKKDRDAILLELEQLANYDAELHESCDYVLKNFEVRQTARDQEIEALKQAKAILSGADFGKFLQMA